MVFWMFTTLCFGDDFSSFEGFLMLLIGGYLECDSNVTNSALVSALILGVQKKMIMLILHAEKKNGVLVMLYSGD